MCPGVYAEQLKIVSKNLTIRGVTSGVLNQVLISPSGVVANSTNAFSGDPIAAVIAIEDAASVVLRNLTVDGSDNRLTACVPTLVGVFYRNASGEAQSMPPFIPCIIGEGGQDCPAVAAATTLFVIPICVFTVLLRKQLLRGITFGAVRK